MKWQNPTQKQRKEPSGEQRGLKIATGSLLMAHGPGRKPCFCPKVRLALPRIQVAGPSGGVRLREWRPHKPGRLAPGPVGAEGHASHFPTLPAQSRQRPLRISLLPPPGDRSSCAF